MIKVTSEDKIHEFLDIPCTICVEDRFIKASFPKISVLDNAFYGIKVDYNIFRLKFSGTYFLISGQGCATNYDEKVYSVPNTLLVDADYDKDLLLGCYFDRSTFLIKELNLTFSVTELDCSDLSSAQIEFFSRTQSPVFNSPAFPSDSLFFGLYRSSDLANGYDVVMNNCEYGYIYAKGNLFLPMKDCVRFDASGAFILRSRFTRMGLELHATSEGFHITNHSNNAIEIKRRMFQYIPLKTFNGAVCKTTGVISTNSSPSTIAKHSTPDLIFGSITQAYNVKKNKIKC